MQRNHLIGSGVAAAILILLLGTWGWKGYRDNQKNQQRSQETAATLNNLQTQNTELKSEVDRLTKELEAEKQSTKCDTIRCDGMCYGVQKGDTLSKLAERFYGNWRLFTVIAEANGILGPNYTIYAEKCICIPKAPAKTAVVTPTPKTPTTSKPKPKEPSQPKPIVTVAPVETPRIAAPPAAEPVAPAPAPQVVPNPAPAPIPTAPQQTTPAVAPPAPTAPVVPEKRPDAEILKPIAATPPVPKISVPPLKQPLAFPGSAWTVAGNLSPTERGNFLNQSYFEQGVTLWRGKRTSIVPFVSLTTTVDNQKFDWNNKATGQAGVKLVESLPNGVLQIGGAYAEEYRFKSKTRAKEPVGFLNYWFGWDQPTRAPAARRLFSAFPGNTWGTVGTLSPTEKRNVIGQIHLQQGVTLTKVYGTSLIPYAESTFGFDTKKFDWNNKEVWGAGFKIAAPLRSGVCETGVAWRQETRFQTNNKAGGLAGSVSCWFGWNPGKGGR